MTNDTLGDRMKQYEMSEAGRSLMPLLPVMIRLDGRSFSKFTDGLEKPVDIRLTRMMQEVTKYLVEETNARLGYTQSDEITLLLYSDSRESQIMFDGRIQKLVSVTTALCVDKFASLLPNLPERLNRRFSFDCRVWNVPTREEAVNCFLWRENDCLKNSISMAVRHYYSHKEVENKNQNQQQELLFAKGVNFNDYPAYFKRGTYVQRRTTTRKFTVEEIESLPPKHEARVNPDLVIERSDVMILTDVPPISKMVNRVEFVFEGKEPVVL